MNQRKSNLSIWQYVGLMVTLVTAIAGVITAHFDGIKAAVKESKIYTDQRLYERENTLIKMQITLDDLVKLETGTKTDIEWIKQRIKQIKD